LVATVGDGVNFGVGFSGNEVTALADHEVVFDDTGTNPRVGEDP
jgi:hypothetical protein